MAKSPVVALSRNTSAGVFLLGETALMSIAMFFSGLIMTVSVGRFIFGPLFGRLLGICSLTTPAPPTREVREMSTYPSGRITRGGSERCPSLPYFSSISWCFRSVSEDCSSECVSNSSSSAKAGAELKTAPKTRRPVAVRAISSIFGILGLLSGLGFLIATSEDYLRKIRGQRALGRFTANTQQLNREGKQCI